MLHFGDLALIFAISAWGGATGVAIMTYALDGFSRVKRPPMPTWASHRDWKGE
jgi:hypothetical protein